MTVSKHRYAASANVTPRGGELSVSELDQVSGGDPVVSVTHDVTQNQQKGAIKSAEAADALIRG